PGVYAYVNHNLIEAFQKGAAGHFVVEGEWNEDLMKQVKAPGPITKENQAMIDAMLAKRTQPAATQTVAKKAAKAAKANAEKGKEGKKVAATHPAGEKLYKAACVACHSAGVANAPKLGDKKAWEPLLERGFDSLMETALNGRGAMPPRGASSADDATLRAAVEYMISTVQ